MYSYAGIGQKVSGQKMINITLYHAVVINAQLVCCVLSNIAYDVV